MTWSRIPAARLVGGLLVCLLWVMGDRGQTRAEEPVALDFKIDIHAVRLGPRVGETLDFSAPAGHGANYNLMSVDVGTRAITTIAQDLSDFRIVAADRRHVAIIVDSPAGQVIVFDRESHGRTTWCCFPFRSGTTGIFIGDTLRLADGSHALTTFTLDRHAPPDTASMGGGTPVFWGDKFIQIAEGRADIPDQPSVLTVLGLDRQFIGTVTIPRQEIRGNGSCTTDAPTVDGHMLAYVSSCGKIVIVDLEAMQVTQTLPYFDPASFYRLAFSGNLLFAAPTDPGSRVTVFDYARGRPIATLPLSTPQLFATGDRLISVHPDFAIKDFNFDVYRIHRAQLLDPVAATAEIVTRSDQAAEALKAGASVEQALESIEAETTAPLLDRLNDLDQHGLAAAALYARLLARSVDRIGEGVALLEKLAARAPDDAKLKVYLKAARARLSIHDAKPDAEADIAGARDITLGKDAGSILLADDRAYVSHYGAALDGVSCATVALHDRATLSLQAIIPAAGCDDGFQDSISDVAVGKSAVYIALDYRFEEAGRPNLIVVDKASMKIISRTDLVGGTGIESLTATADGLLVCRDVLGRSCEMYAQADLAAPPKTDVGVPCRPAGEFFPAAVGNPALLEFVKDGAYVVACNDRLVATTVGLFTDTKLRLARIDALDTPLVEVTVGGRPEVTLGAEGQSSIVSAQDSDRLLLRTIAAESGKVRSELWARSDTDSAAIAEWAAGDDMIFVGRGADLIVYDMTAGRSRAFFKNFMAPAQDEWNQKISRLIVDPRFKRLIVLTSDGRGRIAPLDALRDAGADWRKADGILAED